MASVAKGSTATRGGRRKKPAQARQDAPHSPEQGTGSSEDPKHVAEKPLTILFHELEPWQKDNHYILKGYRPASGSYQISLSSLGYLHNESVNIYSHLLGAALFLGGALKVYTSLKSRYAAASFADVIVFGCFFASAVACLAMSATFHTIHNHSEDVAKFANKLDYLGIVLLIWGSFMPTLYYGYACNPGLRLFYWGMITTIGSGCAVTCVASKFRDPSWRPFRASMFVGMGLAGVIPVLHGLILLGPKRVSDMVGLPWLLLQAFLYILGAFLYAVRVPERYSPGTYDLFGTSHNWLHILVLAAAISHLTGLIKAFDFHHSHSLNWICGLQPEALFEESLKTGYGFWLPPFG